MIVVKTNLDGDLRRFTVEESITFSEILQLLQNLYRLEENDVSLHYHDEEGDEIAITSDLEMTEAVRLSLETRPNILRVNLKRVPSAQVKRDTETKREVVKVEVPVTVKGDEIRIGEVNEASTTSGMNLEGSHCVVYIQGVPKVIKLKEPTPVETECKEKKDSQTHHDRLMIMLNKAKEQAKTQTPTPTRTQPSIPLSTTVLSKQFPVKDIIENIGDAQKCSELSESIARLCLKDSDDLAKETSEISNKISLESRNLSKATSLDIQSSSSPHTYSYTSLSESSKQVLSETDALVANTIATSRQMTETTKALQNESINVMRELLTRDVEEVQTQIRLATRNLV